MIKIRTEDFEAFINKSVLADMARNRAICKLTTEQIMSKRLGNWFMGTSREDAEELIWKLVNKEETGLPLSIVFRFYVQYSDDDKYDDDIKLLKYVKDNGNDEYLQFSHEKAKEIVRVLDYRVI